MHNAIDLIFFTLVEWLNFSPSLPKLIISAPFESLYASVGQSNEIVASQPFSFISLLTIFVLACFVGYYVVWRVTPALHTPLMSVTNAISSIIIVGAIIAVAPDDTGESGILGFIAIIITSINIFGGFVVTQRMLQMFKKKK